MQKRKRNAHLVALLHLGVRGGVRRIRQCARGGGAPEGVVAYLGGHAIREEDKCTDSLVGQRFIQASSLEWRGRRVLMFVFAVSGSLAVLLCLHPTPTPSPCFSFIYLFFTSPLRPNLISPIHLLWIHT